MNRLSTGYEPRFDIDYEYGRQGELFIADVVAALRDNRVEVKRKSYEDDLFYVEYACRKRGDWAESGIATTEAELWAFVIGESAVAVVVTTERLRDAAAFVWKHMPGMRKEETDGSHPTKGVLVPFVMLVDSRKVA